MVYFLGWGLGGLIGLGLKWIRLRVWGLGYRAGSETRFSPYWGKGEGGREIANTSLGFRCRVCQDLEPTGAEHEVLEPTAE